ncbi:hypothetical protein ABBQ38_009958 [Trebouxia sp. C0009 RCD-2024]
MADVVPLVKQGLSKLKSGQLPEVSLLRALVSKALGYGIVAGASLLKLPQILGVLRSGSAAGLNLASFELENIGYSIHTAYGFILGLPFSAYGEAVIILLQNTLLLSIIYHYARAPLWRGVLMIILTAYGGYFVLSGSATEKMVMSAYELNNFIFILARVPQIWSNYKAKDTGQLSLITAGMSTAGAVARIFTSIQEGAGLSMVRGFCIGGFLNLIITLQILCYARNTQAQTRKLANKKE